MKGLQLTKNYSPFTGAFPMGTISLPFTQHLSDGMKPFPCHKCGRSYRNKGSLKRHLVDECGKPPQYICNICKKGFKQKANFQRHRATIHGRTFGFGADHQNLNEKLDLVQIELADKESQTYIFLEFDKENKFYSQTENIVYKKNKIFSI